MLILADFQMKFKKKHQELWSEFCCKELQKLLKFGEGDDWI
jgi:hypothetical protein